MGSYGARRRRRPEMEPFPGDIFNLADIVLRVAREDPERIAVVDLDGWESYGRRRYKRRSRIEIMFGRLKDWRRVATRYDRCTTAFFSAIAIALAATVIF